MKKERKKGPAPRLPAGSRLIDTHCHLDMEAYGSDPTAIIRDAAQNGVTTLITIGIDPASSERAAAIARQFAGVWATVGIHPHSASAAGPADFRRIAGLAADRANKVVGYGEIGLDFARNYSPADVQKSVFRSQLALAGELALPVIIHDREAHADILRILREHAPFPAGGVMHCFSGDIRLAEQLMELGFLISIPGIITFSKSEILRQVAKEIPLDRLILETDAPFLAPVPFRGKINKPEYLLYTAEKIAELRQISLQEVAARTSRNAELLFGLPGDGS